ncbi:hypothetical protein AGMMS50276_26000 [Synergistales bacterium]|nr:hypothetical protein AGMMS50276_26000 [Synergistales bacterium]
MLCLTQFQNQIVNPSDFSIMASYNPKSESVTMTKEQLDFAVFCVESVADSLNMTGDEVYRLMVDESDILDGYIIQFCDTLHTQGKEYIVRELTEVMRERGISI